MSAYVFAAISGFHDAEDVVQRIAQELARRFDEYDPNRPFTGWALWIAKSRVIDFYRVQGRRRIVFSDDLLRQLAETIAQQADGRNQRREALEACLDGLPGKSRRMLELRFVDELSPAEVAREIGSTSGSVRVLLTRIRAALPKDAMLDARDGESLLPLFDGKLPKRTHAIPFTAKGTALIDGDFKLIALGTGKNRTWQLFDLKNDPNENRDVSAAHRERFDKMKTEAEE